MRYLIKYITKCATTTTTTTTTTTNNNISISIGNL